MKYKSCGFIHYGIHFYYENEILLCSQTSHIGGGKIYLLKNFDPKKIDINLLLENRKKILKDFRNGEINPKCNGCMDLKNWEIPLSEPKIKILMIQHWTKCNCNCTYCYTYENKNDYNKRKTYEIYPILKEMIKRNILDKNGIANFSGGEISCLKEFKKVVKLLEKLNYYIIINSSGIKYESIVGKRLKKGSSCIIISVDAGKKETYEKIKNVKTFDKVWENIEKYTKDQSLPHLVNIKYIILPGVNDSMEEINLWLEKCKKINVKNVVLGIDANYFEPNRNNIPVKILNLFNNTRETAERMGLNFFIANRAVTMLTKGKYANPFWEKYRYDEGPYSDLYFETNKI